MLPLVEIHTTLLQRLELSRPLLSHGDSDRRPACAGQPAAGFGHTRPSAEAKFVARTYCARCPLIDECNAFADANQELGVWGGKLRTMVSYNRGTYQARDLLSTDDRVPA